MVNRFWQKFLVILCCFLCSAAKADIRLPAIISDSMVLQQDTAVPIWGWSEPSSKIAVKTTWSKKAYLATSDEKGKWIVTLETPKASCNHEITVNGNNKSLKIKDILVGEVWLCSGQSNMQYPVRNSANSAKEIANANYSDIRLFTVMSKPSDVPLDDTKGKWQKCSPDTIVNFSAVGYFFGREIHNRINVPVGLISSGWGGTPAQSWIKKEVLLDEDELNFYIQRDKERQTDRKRYQKQYEENLDEWKQDAEKARAAGKKTPPKPPYITETLEEKLERWEREVEKAKLIGRRLPPKPSYIVGTLGPQHRCSSLYNGMISPIIPFAIKGVIWYQGEADTGDAYLYRKLFPAMIKNWRNDWDQGNFPFYFVQLANFYEHTPDSRPKELPDIGKPKDDDWAELREAQLLTMDILNTGMVVTMDIGDPYDIHPGNKQDVGKRLALWAFAKDYGFKDIVCCGPLYKKMEIQSNEIYIYFEHIGSGLMFKGNELKGFAIAGKDKEFVWAEAKIYGEVVIVSSDKVARPVAVRYGWSNWIECNLFNKEGLPASPFRTDDWLRDIFGNKF